MALCYNDYPIIVQKLIIFLCSFWTASSVVERLMDVQLLDAEASVSCCFTWNTDKVTKSVYNVLSRAEGFQQFKKLQAIVVQLVGAVSLRNRVWTWRVRSRPAEECWEAATRSKRSQPEAEGFQLAATQSSPHQCWQWLINICQSIVSGETQQL